MDVPEAQLEVTEQAQDQRTEYVADPAAAKYAAAPAYTTTDPREAYEGWERPTHVRYDGWLD